MWQVYLKLLDCSCKLMKVAIILILLMLTSCRPLLLHQEGTPAGSATYRLITEKVRRVKKVKDYYVVVTQKGKRLQELEPYDSTTIIFLYKAHSKNHR